MLGELDAGVLECSEHAQNGRIARRGRQRRVPVFLGGCAREPFRAEILAVTRAPLPGLDLIASSPPTALRRIRGRGRAPGSAPAGSQGLPSVALDRDPAIGLLDDRTKNSRTPRTRTHACTPLECVLIVVFAQPRAAPRPSTRCGAICDFVARSGTSAACRVSRRVVDQQAVGRSGRYYLNQAHDRVDVIDSVGDGLEEY
jgi:hypothetical protein